MQEAWVSDGHPVPLPGRDQALGALLGLATGDALAADIEFEPKPRFARSDDMAAGGRTG